MADDGKLHGDGWNAFFRTDDQQWQLQHRVESGKWATHRIRKQVQTTKDAERYIKIFLRELRKKAKPQEASRLGVVSPDMTFRQLGELWTTGELAAQYPRYIKRKKSARSDESRLRLYVYDHIGDVPIREFEAPNGWDIAQRVVDALPPELSDGSARQVTQAVSTLLGFAAGPLRILKVNPIATGFVTRPAKKKAKSHLFPDDDLKLMRCTRVPLLYRFFFGFLIREGARIGEFLGMQLHQVDLDHEEAHVDRTKTGAPKNWGLQPGTAEALRRYADRFMRSKDPDAYIFAREDGKLLDSYSLSKRLRHFLKLAGVTRPVLFERSEERIPLRAHDTRTSFVTNALATGKTEAWVTERTGHTTSQMINEYRVALEDQQKDKYREWTPLYLAIPELNDNPEEAVALAAKEHAEARDSEESEENANSENETGDLGDQDNAAQ